MKKFLSIVLSAALICTALLAGPVSAENYNSFMDLTFDSCPITSKFTNAIDNLGVSWANVDAKVVSNVISGRSLQMKSGDMRVWNMSVTTKDKFYAEYSFKLDENFNNTVRFCLQLQGYSSTSTEGLDGCVLTLRKGKDGGAELVNRASAVIASVNDEKVHTVKMVFQRGEKVFSVYLDGNLVSDNSKLSGYICKILGFRFNVDSGASSAYIFVDNIKIYTTLSLPQKYSSQKPGTLNNPTLPTVETSTGISFYLNKTKLSVSNYLQAKPGLYVSAKDILKALGASYSYDSSSDRINITADGISASVKRNSNTVKVNGVDHVLTYGSKYEGSTDYISLDMIRLLFGLKVWWDYEGKTVVFSDKTFSEDGILRIINGKLYMNGEPFYEISFNKFDLAYQLFAEVYDDKSFPDPKYRGAAAEEALSQLHDAGFKTIRVFCTGGPTDALQTEESKAKYYGVFDKMFDLCDKYDIKVVCCMGIPSDTFLKQVNVGSTKKPVWVSSGDSTLDVIADPNCESRQCLYDYIREFVGRYKNRESVLMWEIVNEGNLGADIGGAVGSPTYSLLQLGQFYADCAKVFHEADPDRLVTGGDSILRSSQWNLLKGTMSGSNSPNWTMDTYRERLYALWTINFGLDVVSEHAYGVGYERESGVYKDKSGREVFLTFNQMISETNSIGKVLYIGEIGGTIGATTSDIQNPAIAKAQAAYLDQVIAAGVQLTHWWSFHPDRQGFGDENTWGVNLTQHKHTFDMIISANKKLQQKYVVNSAVSAEKVVPVEKDIPAPTTTPTPKPTATPTPKPTATPTPKPTATPTPKPTATPTPKPTATPTPEPTATPTPEPTATPTPEPTATPTPEPTATPTPEPTATPTPEPTATPTSEPTATPTPEPTAAPTSEPTAAPTSEPTTAPTEKPSENTGCGGIISSATTIIAIAALGMAVFTKKKKE